MEANSGSADPQVGLTCSPDARAAMHHHRGSLWVAGPLESQTLHQFPLLPLHGSQEVDERRGRAGDAVVGPAEVLEVTHLPLLTGLNGYERVGVSGFWFNPDRWIGFML